MEQKIVYIPMDHLAPHPHNPRKDLGDLSELTESIKAKGILQNLTVVPMDLAEPNTKHGSGFYTVLIGHRRAAAAKLAGLTELPCVVVEMSHEDQLATMLVENMQRSDLTIYEQAKGFQMMLDLGKTISEVSEISGFSEATVRRRAKLAELDEKKFKKAVDRGATLYDFAELDKLEDPEVRDKLLGSIGTKNFKNELESALTSQKRKKQVDTWVEQISAFAQKLDKVDWKGSSRIGTVGDQTVPLNYIRSYCTWSRTGEDITKPDDETEYFYTVSDTDVTLFAKANVDLEKEEQERLKAEEIKAEHKKLVEKFRDMTERHRKLRLDFIKEFNQYDRKDTTVWEFVTEALIEAKLHGGGYSNNNLEDLAAMLNVSMTDTSPPDLDYSEFLSEKLHHPQRTALITSLWVLDRGGYWREFYDCNARRYRVIYKDNDHLDMVYRLLSQLGYLQSTEEQELRKGTHKLFFKPEEYDGEDS